MAIQPLLASSYTNFQKQFCSHLVEQSFHFNLLNVPKLPWRDENKRRVPKGRVSTILTHSLTFMNVCFEVHFSRLNCNLYINIVHSKSVNQYVMYFVLLDWRLKEVSFECSFRE